MAKGLKCAWAIHFILSVILIFPNLDFFLTPRVESGIFCFFFSSEGFRHLIFLLGRFSFNSWGGFSLPELGEFFLFLFLFLFYLYQLVIPAFSIPICLSFLLSQIRGYFLLFFFFTKLYKRLVLAFTVNCYFHFFLRLRFISKIFGVDGKVFFFSLIMKFLLLPSPISPIYLYSSTYFHSRKSRCYYHVR